MRGGLAWEGGTDLARPTKMQKELEEIKNAIPKEKWKIADDLINELCFMKKTLDALKKEIRRNGTVERFEQGKQNFLRENPALKSYNTTIQRYGTIYKQLSDMVPKQNAVPEKEADGFEDFVKRRDAG